MSSVLVTGGSGFIGTHCIVQLLAAGHTVRTTVRNLKREPEVRAMLKEGGADAGDRLTFFAADLEKDAGWPEAVAGCDYVLHVASPFPATVPKDENELIVPAREGARSAQPAVPMGETPLWHSCTIVCRIPQTRPVVVAISRSTDEIRVIPNSDSPELGILESTREKR